MSPRWIDLLIIAFYLAGMVWIGLRSARKQSSTEAYFVAKRSIPSWAMGISLFATLISSVTFIAYPGSAYGKDWSLLIPGMMALVVLALVGSIIIPFYRSVVGMSAYEYFGKRFGRTVRVYSSVAFAAGHFSKMGFVFYLVALTMNTMTGWNIDVVIVVAGFVTVFYTLIGGLEAVIWTDVVQGFVMWVGILIALAYLLFTPPGGPAAVFRLAWGSSKFSLGDGALDLSKPTIIVLALYGLFWYLQKYTADQTLVQRYLVAKSDRGAMRGVALGALLCMPVWTLFMLIGTCTWAFYKLTQIQLPAHIVKADQVFPYFLSTQIPPGLAGLFMASMLAAAMSTLASDLNCLAVVGVEDFYRLLKPQTTDRERLRMGKAIVAACGGLCIALALYLAHSTGSALSLWYTVSAIVAGGLAGLFFLAFFSRRANKAGALTGIGASLIFTTWATLTLGAKPTLNLGQWNFPYHDYMIGVIGHVIVLGVGYFASLPFARRNPLHDHMTLWDWLVRRKSAESRSREAAAEAARIL